MRGSNSYQQANKKKIEGTSSDFFGVTYCKQKKKWKAKITYKYKTINLGLFDTDREAAIDYLKAARTIHGANVRIEDQKRLGMILYPPKADNL